MKIITNDDISAHRHATIIGGLQGAGIAASVLTPSFFLLQRRSMFFRGLPLPLKAFMGVTLTLPLISFMGEKGGERYDRSQWTGIGMQEIRAEENREKSRLESLTTWERVKDWSNQNKWGIVAGAWVAAMGGSFALISRNKTQTFSQKLVQARVYSQGLTIALMLAVAVLSGMTDRGEEVVQLKNTDHSWRDILEQEGYSLKDGEDLKVSKRAEQHTRTVRAAHPQ